jgi:hypothetical protein
MAPLIQERHRLERSTQVGFTRLAHVQAPISGKPEIGVCSAPLRAALRPGHESATQHSCATAGRAKNQPAGVGNDRRPRSIVQGLLFTMDGATPTCRTVSAVRRASLGVLSRARIGVMARCRGAQNPSYANFAMAGLPPRGDNASATLGARCVTQPGTNHVDQRSSD